MYQDLRSFIEKVRQESPEEVLTISKEVDPRFDITALVVKLEQERRFPIMVFERVKGSKFPVVTNVHASRRRLASAGGRELFAQDRKTDPAAGGQDRSGQGSRREGQGRGPARPSPDRPSSGRCG